MKLLILILSIVILSTTASAQEVDPGITPDSPFYFLDTLHERIQLMLTFNEEKKVALQERIANEKIAEMNYLLQHNHTNAFNHSYKNFLYYANHNTIPLENALHVLTQNKEQLNNSAIDTAIQNIERIQEEIKTHNQKGR